MKLSMPRPRTATTDASCKSLHIYKQGSGVFCECHLAGIQHCVGVDGRSDVGGDAVVVRVCSLHI